MAAINTQGTTYSINSQLVGQIVSISGFDGEASDIDVTNLDSTSKEFLQGLQDYGNMTLEVIVDPDDAGQTEARDQKTAQTLSTHVLTLPDDVTLNVATFQAYVKSSTINAGVDAAATGTINMKISGDVVWSDSTP